MANFSQEQKYKMSSAYSMFWSRQYKNNDRNKRVLLNCKIDRYCHMFRSELVGHFGCVNAIEFSHGCGEWIASGGDDRRVLLWNVQEAMSGLDRPRVLKGQHNSNIFCIAFCNENKKIYSGGNDEQVILHNAEIGTTQDVFYHDEAVYGVCVNPTNSQVFSSACDDGKVRIIDTRAPPSEDAFILASYNSPMHGVMYNPVEPRLLVTANAKEGLGLWDVRKPKIPLLRYGGSVSQQSCMSVRISRDGQRVIALRRRLPPIMYHIHSSLPVCQFDHNGYYNSCTMKSCAFGGDRDQFVLSGSDDFKVYMWRIPDEPPDLPWVGSAHAVMEGHRSIVNHARFNEENNMVISSGIEKTIKVWSPFNIPLGGKTRAYAGDTERPVYTHEEYINLVLHSGNILPNDLSQQSTSEDPRMMAFFDSLVQRELEGWSSDESAESSNDVLEREIQLTPERSDHSSFSHSDDEFASYSPFTLAFASILGNGRSGSSNEDAETDNSHMNASDIRSSDHTVQQDNVSQSNADNTAARNNTNEAPAPPMEPEPTDNGAVIGLASLMPGQAPLAARQRISDLISIKRKEYLINARKVMIDAHRRKRLKRSRKKPQGDSSDDDTGDEGVTTSQVSNIVKDTGMVPSDAKRIKEIKQRLHDEDEEAETRSDARSETKSETFSDKSYNDGIGPHLKKDMATLGNVASSHTETTEQPSTSQLQTTSGSEQHTTWAEFKRFKHRVERARRQYRQSQQINADQSSDSD